jgi:hypothetical protein
MMMKNLEKAKGQRLARHPAAEADPRVFPLWQPDSQAIIGKTDCEEIARREEDDARRSDLRRGWYWGSEPFAEQMLQIGGAALRKTRSRGANVSREKQAHGEQEAVTKRHFKTQSSSRACGTKFRKHWR